MNFILARMAIWAVLEVGSEITRESASKVGVIPTFTGMRCRRVSAVIVDRHKNLRPIDFNDAVSRAMQVAKFGENGL